VIELRAATLDDCERVWAWNFAPDVRAVSNTPAVSMEEHARWYSARLEQDTPMWIVLADEMPVGVVRLEPDAGIARISIALAGEARGRGIGRTAIRTVCGRWRQPIVAEIHSANAASIACFAACDFEPIGHDLYRWSP